MLGTTVSIIDQDTPTLQNLISCLYSLGYPVLPINRSFDDATEQITHLRPQLVFFNIRKGMVGVSQEIIGGLSLLDVPLILVVDHDDKNLLDTQSQVIQFDWIVKPIIKAELQATAKLALFRYKTNQKIIEQQEQIKAITHSIGEGLITFDNYGNIAYMNIIAEMMTGWDKDEAYGKKLSDVITIITDNDQRHFDITKLIRNRADTGLLTEYSISLLSRDGNKIPVRARISPIRDQPGNMYGGVISFGNISELQQAVQQAKLHNQRADSLIGIIAKLNSKLNLDNVLQALLEETTTITEAEGSLVILFNEYDKNYQVVATHSIDNCLHKYKGQIFPISEPMSINLDDQNQPVRVFYKKNDPALLSFGDLLAGMEFRTLTLAPLISDKNLLGVMFISGLEENRRYPQDELHFLKGLADHASLAISNARLFENVSKSRFRLQILSKKLVEIQEAERRSLARELHDQIGQMLTGLQFALESGKRSTTSETKLVFQEAQEIISDLIKQVRDLSLRLLPSMLEDIGLLPTLQWHFEQYFTQTGIQVNFSQDGLKDNRFPNKIEITAYRIVQEGLTNVARYAQVNEVNVNIKICGSVMRLDISDDGIGFDPEKTITTNHSFGLIGMRERVTLIGGDLRVIAAPGKGTQLKVCLPLENYIERRKYAR